MSHCSLNFEFPRLGYGFLSIILVLEKCNLGPWKSLKSAWILYFEFATNPVECRRHMLQRHLANRVERTQLHEIVNRSWKLTKKSYYKLVVGHTTKQMKHGHSCDIQIWWPEVEMSHSGRALMRHFQPRVHHIWMSHSLPCIICIMLHSITLTHINRLW